MTLHRSNTTLRNLNSVKYILNTFSCSYTKLALHGTIRTYLRVTEVVYPSGVKDRASLT